MMKLLLIVFVVLAIPAVAGEFEDPIVIERTMQNAPAVMREAIEEVCTQEQIDAIEATVDPPLTVDQTAELLDEAAKLLRLAGSENATAVAAERERVKPSKPAEKGAIELPAGDFTETTIPVEGPSAPPAKER
jgi:hypothetical protein